MSYKLDEVKGDVGKLTTVVQAIREMYPRMELGQLHVLLLILAKPGMRMYELIEPTGLTKAAVSRNVRALSDVSYLNDDAGVARRGLNLVTTMTDPMDARSRIVAPTSRGKRLAKQISEILRGNHGKTQGEALAK